MNICILGTGAYGIAMALMFYKNKCNITMWTKFEEEMFAIEKTRSNEAVLPGIKIPDDIKLTTNLEQAVSNANLIVVAVPAGAVNDVSIELKQYFKSNQHICVTSKGIEQGTCLFVTEVINKYIKTNNIGIISGASFAIDVAKNAPIGLSLATKNKETEELIMKTLQNDSLKIRSSEDIIGLEICGSVKNIMAIASGIVSGLGFPESTTALFITESLHDIKNLIDALGGNKNTILSYAGFGDLLLTCTSTKSRNYILGYMIGSNKPRNEIENYIKTTTIEGLYTLKSIYILLNDKNVDIPMIDLIYEIVVEEKNPNLLAKFLIEKK